VAFLARLLGPLLARELLRLARSPVLRLAMIGAPTFLLLLMLAEGNTRMTETSSGQAAAASSRLAGQTFMLAGLVLALALPLWICPTIVRERREGGLDLILTTQLSTHEVLLGIAGASAAVSAGVVASLAPVLSMMTLFGGVDFFSILANTFLLALEVVCLTGGCLHAAAVQQTPVRATILGAFQGLIAFAGLAIVAAPGLHGIAGLSGGFFVKFLCFLLLAAIFGGIAAGLFHAWLQQATGSFLNAHEEIIPAYRRVERAATETESSDVKRSAMWGPLKIRLDDSEPTRFQIRAVWFLYLAVGMPFCWLIRAGQGTTVSPLLLIIWIVIQPFLIVVAATNPLLGRRPGFFDDLLTTNLPEKEIVSGVLWIVQPALIRLLAAPVGLAVLWFALNPIGHTVGTIIGLAWTAELVLVGSILSLADGRLSMRLLGIFAFWSLAGVAPILVRVVPSPEISTLPFAAVFLAFLGWFAQRKATWPRTLLFCMFVHAAAACLGGWIGSFFVEKMNWTPLHLATPLPWLSLAFWDVRTDDLRIEVKHDSALAALPFAISMFVAWLFLWWWLEKKFNQLVGRTDLKSARPTPPRAA
jgi:hypothetical protein